jgi:hypothetical protein
VLCRPLPPSRMPAAIRSGISGRMEDMKEGLSLTLLEPSPAPMPAAIPGD